LSDAGVPESGDIVIRTVGWAATLSFNISAVPGPAQIACRSRGEAERIARSYAEHAAVDIWCTATAAGLSVVERFRESTPHATDHVESMADVADVVDVATPPVGQTDERNTMIDRARIEAVLDRIRPSLLADGVSVELVDVGESGASVRFTGLCEQCASAPLTMHTGLSEVLREEIPGFGELRLV
jgi:Fe-S cluster biogenesis protein NfuA